MKPFNLILGIFCLLITSTALGHHYKGLPHYSYFENYPQIPYLEFIKETKDYEVFVTVYNFQGMNLEQVESPDDVRLYMYLYDLEQDTVFKRNAKFQIYSHNKLIHDTGVIAPEQENIFVIQEKIEEQDNLMMKISFKNARNELVTIDLPFQITKTFLQKYGIYIAILLFFAIVIGLKVLTNKMNARKEAPPKSGGLDARP